MLNEKIIKEQIKIEDDKVYACYASEETKRQLNGCQTRQELAIQILNKQNEIETMQIRLNILTKELAELIEIDNQLTGKGYCKIDRPSYKKIDGIVQKDDTGAPIIEKYIHDEYCSHKEC